MALLLLPLLLECLLVVRPSRRPWTLLPLLPLLLFLLLLLLLLGLFPLPWLLPCLLPLLTLL